MGEFAQGAVSRVVWPWQTASATGEPTGKRPRIRKAITQILVVVIVVSCLLWASSRPHLAMAFTVLFIGGTLSLLEMAAPSVAQEIDRVLWGRIGYGVGVFLTWLLLAPFFYTCFLGGRIILKLRRKDPLCRTFPAPGESCWVEREPITDREHFTRQY